MGNILDYIKWRGDLSFGQAPFNEADNLVLAYLSYLDMDGIGEAAAEEGLLLPGLAERFFALHTQEELEADKSFLQLVPSMLREAAASRRFGRVRACCYVNEVVTREELQFSAVKLILEDGSIYVAFRGTDDSIVGWKEDFNLSNGIVPAQLRAVEYLRRVCRGAQGIIRVGGHSKGGNLAVYAAAMCGQALQEYLTEVYDNDGPGFTPEFWQNEEAQAVLSRITRIIPESSVIGMLLEHAKEPVIVESSQKGVFQHDGFSWQVLGPSFIRADELAKRAVRLDAALHKWISQMDMEQRDRLIEDLFSVIEATGAHNLSQVQEGGLKSFTAMARHLEKLAPESKAMVQELIRSLFAQWAEAIKLQEGKLPVLDKIPFLP